MTNDQKFVGYYVEVNGTVAELDEMLQEFRARYVNASKKARKTAISELRPDLLTPIEIIEDRAEQYS
jgi:hypothetical protein